MIGNVSSKVGACTLLETIALLNFWETTMGTREDTPVQTMRGHSLFDLTADREKEKERHRERRG